MSFLIVGHRRGGGHRDDSACAVGTRVPKF